MLVCTAFINDVILGFKLSLQTLDIYTMCLAAFHIDSFIEKVLLMMPIQLELVNSILFKNLKISNITESR